LSPYALLAIALLILAFGGGLYVLNWARSRAAALVSQAQAEASRILEAARREAERLEKEATLETKERMLNWRAEFERESQERRQELSALDKRLSQKEAGLDLRAAALEEKEKESLNREGRLRQNEAAVTRQREEVDRLLREQQRQLEKLSGLTTEDAKRQLLKTLEQEARRDAANLVKRIEDEAREQAQVLARRYTVEAIQRSAADHAAETTVSVVDLPNDDLKGRIIGREGRNIRALEMATGVDLIVDDTPGAIILSGFDPVRREIAKITIERLIVDGRIHPARIEEMVERVKAELDEQMRQTGEAAAFELGIHDLHPELIRLLGRLKYRTSYGQNVLQHSKEVAYLSGFLARECGANAAVAIRGGLLHDIGKAIDRDVEGTHLELGIDLLHKYSESEEVVWAMEAHHLDREFRTLESMLVQAADAISASRPGARRDLLESYVKRLEKLESIAGSFKGVSKSFALQAGREIRIVVEADKVSDEETFWLSKDVARRIESELQYPGQIKVTVIRETRAVDYAK
jgi:ribonuclease Y